MLQKRYGKSGDSPDTCYSPVRIHQTLKCTPAMKAKVADHKWNIEEKVDLLPEATHPNYREGSN